MAFRLPRPLKQRIKGQWKRLRLAYTRRRYRFTKTDLEVALRKVGVASGDVLLVHSCFDNFEAFQGTALDVIRALQTAVGSSGAILMPTLPFSGTAIDYASDHPVFDVKKTPSRMGLISEIFRRCPDVVRSAHPTHSLAAWGTLASEIISAHHLAQTPCDRYSPYWKLLEMRGKVLFLGTDIQVMTFFHAVEAELESRMPFSPFTTEVFTLATRDAEGNIHETRSRLFAPEYSRRRDLTKLVPVLQQRRQWRSLRLQNLSMILLLALDVLEAAKSLSDQGIYCYD